MSEETARLKLPERRQGITEVLTYRKDEPGEVKFATTFNWEDGGKVKEVFCLAFKEGTDLRTLLHHACMVVSVALQSGNSMAGLAKVLGEDNPERPVGSILGLIVRAGVTIDVQRGFPAQAMEAAQ